MTDDTPDGDLSGDGVIDWRDFRYAVMADGTAPAGTNLVKISQNEYDNGGVGDGNLTRTTLFPGGSEADRVTEYHYDWRNRLVATKGGVYRSFVYEVDPKSQSGGMAYPAVSIIC